jgi:hypothetical protein
MGFRIHDEFLTCGTGGRTGFWNDHQEGAAALFEAGSQ